MLLNNIFSCALADSARLNLVFMSNISILLILFFGGRLIIFKMNLRKKRRDLEMKDRIVNIESKNCRLKLKS